MRKINIADVASEHRVSPKGSYELTRQHVSLALGGKKDLGPWGGGHPFDIELTTLPPGKKNFPLHSHAAQTEHYIILSGTGLMHNGQDESLQIGTGDHLICYPGEAHQLENTGTENLVYYVIADHHRADITSYPRTGKRQIKPEYRVVETTDVDYYKNEE